MCKVFVLSMEWTRNKKVIYRKRDLRANLFFNKRPLLQGRAISRQSQVCRVSQLSLSWRNPRQSPKGSISQPLEQYGIFLWKVSERPLLRDVGKMHLKYDGLSPTVIGHDLNPAGA